jgi:hypothetical protein
VLALAAGPRPVRAGEAFYAGAVQYATGDFVFADRTSSVYVLNGVSYATDRWTVSASVPIIYQNTALVSNTGPGMLPGRDRVTGISGGHHHSGMMDTDATASMETFDEVGVGDPLLRADIAMVGGRAQRYSVALSATVKTPIANADHGFGTGEWDSAGGMTGRYAAGNYTGAASVFYWWMGDPDGVDFENPVAYSVSAFRLLGGSRFSAGVSVSGFTRIARGTDGFRQLGTTVMYVPDASRSLSAGLSFGLSDTAPDFGVSIGWGLVL